MMGFAWLNPSYGNSLQSREVGHQIVAILLSDALENPHGGAGDHGGGKHHPAADGVLGPFPIGAVLEGVVVGVARNGAGLLADNAEQVGAEPVVTALLVGVADRALPHESGLAL